MKEVENPVLNWIIFLVLNLIIAFIIILPAILKTTESANFYEKAYAKRISLLIDDAKPNTLLFIDVAKGSEIASKFEIEPEFTIKDNAILVKLAKGSGHSDTFFRNLDVKLSYLDETKLLQIEINEKKQSA